MMSAIRAGACWPLLIRRSAQRPQRLDGQRPIFLVLDIATRQWPCLPSFEGDDDVLALPMSSPCRANLARGLRVHSTRRIDS
jgi:hypothetical protein